MSAEAVKKTRKFSLFVLLKALTIVEVPLMLVPGVFLSVALLGELHFGWPDFWKGMFALTTVTVCAAVLGYLAVRYDTLSGEQGFSKTKSLALKIVAYAVSPIVSVPLALLLWPIRTDVGLYGYLAPWLPMVVVLEACWITAVQQMPGSYTASYSTGDFIKCALLYLIPIAVLEILRKLIPTSYDVTTMALSFSIYTILGCIIVNQQNIDLMMERRRHDKSSLPGKIRVYNLLLICALLILVFSGLLIGEQLGALIIWALKRFGLAIVYIIGFVFWLMSLGQGGGASGGSSEGGGDPDMSAFAEGAKENPIWDIIAVVIVLCALYAIYSNRKRIWEVIRNFFVRIATRLYHFFLDCFKIQELGSVEGYYTEEAEDLTGEERYAQLSGFKTKREMKKALKQWQKTTDPEKRVRDGYRLLMMASRTQEKNLLSSDTTGEILEKNRKGSLERAFEQVNPVYDRVRYDGAIPDAAELSGFSAKVEESCLSVDVKKKK